MIAAIARAAVCSASDVLAMRSSPLYPMNATGNSTAAFGIERVDRLFRFRLVDDGQAVRLFIFFDFRTQVKGPDACNTCAAQPLPHAKGPMLYSAHGPSHRSDRSSVMVGMVSMVAETFGDRNGSNGLDELGGQNELGRQSEFGSQNDTA
ncbi:hypothetical protein [Bifidobacterium callimiconis]|uniref:hypothetical protein n=1 Tax=Bifidobacterium callimiconis TaxID=2306973 RepID=UPI000F7F5C96|nr:hypothetical protein [Bifidobacterium callimiconis]